MKRDSIVCGNILTMDLEKPRVKAMAISNGRIVRTGTFEECRDALPRDFEKHDFGEATVLPGIIDSHNHMLATSLQRTLVGFVADVVATAKRDLAPGEVLDGEGGYLVWGKLMPAADSLKIGGLPIGLACNLKIKRHVAEGASLTWDDVELDEGDETYRFRRAMEKAFS